MIFLTILAFVFIFSGIILIHEFGHFYAAKKSGVKVEEFGIGLPPRIWGKKKGETLYSINLIPFGGFVKMLGEFDSDSADKSSDDKSSADKGSGGSERGFNVQSFRKQLFIVCAGVIMNFLSAFFLLTFGFVIGIEPLIVDQDDFYENIKEGNIDVEPITPEGDSFQRSGDSFNRIDGEAGEKDDVVYIPRLVYSDNIAQMYSERAETSFLYGLLEDGDVIIKINGEEVFLEDDFYESLGNGGAADFEIYRPGEGTFSVEDLSLPEFHPVISIVESGSPAQEAGLVPGDVIVAVAGKEVFVPSDIVEIIADYDDSLIEYSIFRAGETIDMSIPLRDDGRVGIGAYGLFSPYSFPPLYLSNVPHDFLGTQKVTYGFYAPVVAVEEMYRLGKLTAVMFFDVFTGFLSMDEVPEGVAGPVGIAQMTFVNIQNGFSAILRFVALLSLSLGVINILPIPALDGGRAVFIIYRAITGHNPNPSVERWIHSAGFFLLILFIIYITFNDVLSLF